MRYLLLLTILSITTISAQNYNYLGSYTSNGTPLYLDDNDIVSVETLELIDSSLPESYPVPEYNPHYISSGYDTDIMLQEDADIWVTFVSEGAGYRNVLGFYTYDINNPSPTVPDPEDITIIFPNVSALGSGGGLEAGNKVKIGNFEAGTGIGWVLLANAWNGQQVTSGYWQLYSNPDYNPESNPDLRYHNVLLQDPENERVILGFEDIRRDYGSCDNDFNDAVFYITASPYSAMTTNNYADVDSATDIYSANNGGLESNGNLATLIAKRNFKRAKNNTALNKKSSQTPYRRSSSGTSTLDHYFPQTGMFYTETPYVSSPGDLLEITNATEVFAVDYYNGDKRVSAGLATRTATSVYDHSKMICDRLNGSKLKDVRNVNIQGYQVIYAVIERDNGNIEYAVSFSIQENPQEYKLHSRWNIEEYPAGSYINFQLWGCSVGQVATLANEIIRTLQQEKVVTADVVEDRVPTVFISEGKYQNGTLELVLTNKSNASYANINASIARTEFSEREDYSKEISLNGEWTQTVTVPTGYLFDAGLSLVAENSNRSDALYLADGPWGVDHLDEEAIVDVIDIMAQDEVINANTDTYVIERGIEVIGEVKGTFNVFRNILAGDLTLDASEYEAITFDIKNTRPVEVILVTENLEDWNNRLRYTLPAYEETERRTILFEEFLNANNVAEEIQNIRSVVFSIQGDYSTFNSFELEVNNVTFDVQETLSVTEETVIVKEQVYNYPNPFRGKTTIKLPNSSRYVTLTVVDMLGRRIYHKELKTKEDGQQVTFINDNLARGLYSYRIIDDNNKIFNSSFLID
ncbi:DUF4114 domain-containing protein [Aquimarina rhabdastrellae]